jgi:hypothetical protein
LTNGGSGTTLAAEGITALGEGGASSSYGLSNSSEALLLGGSFTGRSGSDATGISNTGDSTILQAERVTARGEDGTINYGLYNNFAAAQMTQSVFAGLSTSVRVVSGDVTISNSRLVGGAVDGTVTCVLVTRNGTISTDGSTCP